MVYNFELISANKYMLKVSNSNSKVWNLFEVNNKGTKTTSTTSLWFMANRLLSKYFFLQPFSPKIQFFTVYLIYYLLEVPPRWPPKVEFLRFTSPDCWKMHFRQFLWLRKHNLHIVEKYDFFREYYDLVIDLHEIASH